MPPIGGPAASAGSGSRIAWTPLPARWTVKSGAGILPSNPHPGVGFRHPAQKPEIRDRAGPTGTGKPDTGDRSFPIPPVRPIGYHAGGQTPGVRLGAEI